MKSRVWPPVMFSMYALCVAVNFSNPKGQNVADATDLTDSETSSSGTIPSSSRFTTEKSETANPTLTSIYMTTATPKTTVATTTKSVGHSNTTLPSTAITAPPNTSSYYTSQSSVTPTVNSSTTDSQINNTSSVSPSELTPVVKPTLPASAATSKQPVLTDVTQPYTASLYSVLTTGASVSQYRMKSSEIILTITFSVILGLTILGVIMYNVTKCIHKREHYLHRPLYNSSHSSFEEPGGSYNIPDDTLVISGGLYDDSRVYNPNMTILEDDDDLRSEYPTFNSKYSQFRLEFLPEERESTASGSSFVTFKPDDFS
ncbi:sialomucin core protein 24-like [Callorhinchus milii]|uniref:A-agglutinin anchorage subunit-like n=2 Tax=Callorhinchus milii TaxID=7868 RepID=A0A4W3IN14_CALMI|nr:sialomucin core protein 24-like [Callorhinchus milii]XP_007899809.1 sialomucin core protein 24-like [Callorhinchus milii]|eukprot:gi/632967129/ref/XP_007899808.1/ PREDICTED: A-agglutinin anchorage subunit-like [Callorhinchus milii]